MSIYAKKNSKGQPTGKWVAEVTRGGKRHRHVADTIQEAQEAEAVMQAGDMPAMSPRPSTSLPMAATGYLVADLRRQALVVWRGTKDEDQSAKRFEAVCDIIGDSVLLSAVRTSALDDVVDTLRARSLSNKTIHRYLAAFSGAMRWAVSRDKLVGMPIIPWPKCGKGNDTTISAEDERRVLQRLQRVGSPDVALVMDALLATGCRVGELLALTPDDIGTASVTFRDTKNSDDREVPLEPALAVRLKALSLVGFPTYRRINTSLHAARKALKVEHKVTSHVFRHTVGTRLSAHGVEVPTIGHILGHRNVKTTMGYIHPEKDTVRAAARHLIRGAGEGNQGAIGGQSEGNRGGNRPNPKVPPMSQAIEKMEASPRIELGYKDLQSDDDV